MSISERMLQGPDAGAGTIRQLSRGFRMSRWLRRISYASYRFSKALKVLQVRLWRKPSVRLYYARTDYAPPPCMITLRLTSNCNLRCVQCGQWGERGVFTQPDRSPFPKEMCTQDWKSFIARVASFCPHIYFFGGEPFLRKDCLELVKYADSKNVITGVNTNANFLRGTGKAIVDSGMDYLIVSLDGPKEVNNQIRLGKLDVYEAVVAGVEELVRAKRQRRQPYPLIEMCMTLTDMNQAHIVETAEVALKLGVDYFAVNFGIFTTPGLADESTAEFKAAFGVEPHFYKAFVRDLSRIDPLLVAAQIGEVRRRWGSRYKQYPPVNFDISGYYRKPEMPLVRWPCVAPWVTMQVMPNGDMAFCGDFADLMIGNVRECDPLTLWNNAASRAWRRRIRTKGIFRAETRCCDYYLQ